MQRVKNKTIKSLLDVQCKSILLTHDNVALAFRQTAKRKGRKEGRFKLRKVNIKRVVEVVPKVANASKAK